MGKINQWSFQRFLRFFNKEKEDYPGAKYDDEFENKINAIKNEISNGNRDMEDIAEKAGCTYEECIFKISYLKNKREIPDFYMDNNAKMLREATTEQEKLLNIYSKYIYNDHATFDDIVRSSFQLRGNVAHNLNDYIPIVDQELLTLYDAGLLNGVIYNHEDHELLYYAVEKRKFSKRMITLTCPNCGALVDIDLFSKARCKYCNTLVDGDAETKKLIEEGIITVE